MNKLSRAIGALVASGALALTGAAAAHADTSSSTGSSTTSASVAPAPSPGPGAHRDRCAQAAARVARLEAHKAKVEARIDRLQKAADKASAGHHDELAKKLEARIDHAKKMRERIGDRIRRIERRCGNRGVGSLQPRAPVPTTAPAPAPAPSA